MPKRAKIPNADTTRGPAWKVNAYGVLFNVNERFEEVLAQLQQLDSSVAWRQLSKRLRRIVAETRAEVSFELVEFLQERELRGWTRLGAARKRTATSKKSVNR